MVIAQTPELLQEVTASLDRLIRAAFLAADHFIFTFGMTEVFRCNRSGRIACQVPGYGGGGGAGECSYVQSDFAENLAAVRRILDLIAVARPEATVFVTVSPVPLKRSFSGVDVVVANTLSKSTLRAVLAEAVTGRDSAVYFPSYEAVISEGAAAFIEDGRHVRRDLVEDITRTFLNCYFGEASEIRRPVGQAV
jgi:hypothetical protein